MKIRIRTAVAQQHSDPRNLMDRVSNLFLMARVTRLDASGDQLRAQVKTRLGEIEDDIPVLTPVGLKHRKKGETLLARWAGHRRNTAAIVTDSGIKGGAYLQDGDVALDDDRGLHIWLAADGIVIEANGLPVTIKNTSKLRVEGPIESTDEITAKVDGDAIPLSTHLTKGVQSGTDTSEGPKKP